VSLRLRFVGYPQDHRFASGLLRPLYNNVIKNTIGRKNIFWHPILRVALSEEWGAAESLSKRGEDD